MGRRGGFLRLLIGFVVICVISMVLILIVLRATDKDGKYHNVTKKAQSVYSSLSGATQKSESPTGQTTPTYQVEATVADDVMQTPADGLNVPALQLLPTRISQELPIKHLSQKEEAEIAEGVRKFLNEWETFEPSDQTYQIRLGRIVPQAYLDRIVQRRDSRQLDGVGPCDECTIGSAFQPKSLDPGDYMQIHGYDGNWAYVTTEGTVELDGTVDVPDRWRRQYALIMNKFAGHWAVARAIAETKGVEQH